MTKKQSGCFLEHCVVLRVCSFCDIHRRNFVGGSCFLVQFRHHLPAVWLLVYGDKESKVCVAMCCIAVLCFSSVVFLLLVSCDRTACMQSPFMSVLMMGTV